MNMKKSKIKAYIFFILVTVLGGLLTGYITSRGVYDYELSVITPALTPPSEVFPVVWTVLYTLMGISAAMIWNATENGDDLFIYWMQLLVNYFWSFLFFGFKMYLIAFVWLLMLLVLIISMIVSFYSKRKLASYLQIPYALWVAFAGYLNFSIWMINR